VPLLTLPVQAAPCGVVEYVDEGQLVRFSRARQQPTELLQPANVACKGTWERPKVNGARRVENLIIAVSQHLLSAVQLASPLGVHTSHFTTAFTSAERRS
jgi:hypothetical protein